MRQQTRQQHSGKFTSTFVHTYKYVCRILFIILLPHACHISRQLKLVATKTFYDFCHHSCCHLLLLQQFTALCIIYMSMTHVLCRHSHSLCRLPPNIFYTHLFPVRFSSFICIMCEPYFAKDSVAIIENLLALVLEAYF